jgi:phosphatidylserine/phosphatidylglycerophosphate/cardiolipin synthase-like enzyme
MQGGAYRDIATAHNRQVPRDFLQSLMVAELLQPSRPLWIVSPWISDVELIDNSARHFSALCSAWPAGPIRLSLIVGALLDHGGQVRVMVNDDTHNDDFALRMATTAQEHAGAFALTRVAELHAKGIISERWCLEGSMNLTYSGVFRNDEQLIYRTDPEVVQQKRLELSRLWADSA